MGRFIPKELRIRTAEQVFSLPSVPFDQKRFLPDRPGVYFVVQASAIIYVGFAPTSLKRRWQNHEQTRAARREAPIHIFYVACDSEIYCERAEIQAIAALQPALNVTYKRWHHVLPKGKPRKPPADA